MCVKNVGKCGLCHRVDALKFSHIIPELCYKPLYDEKHRAISMDINSKEYIQKGFREYLFCENCEQLFSKFEKYFSETWFKKLDEAAAELHENDLKQIVDLDYAKFKLFHISILFRASVSKLDQFNQVNLGPNQEVLRQMLLAQDPGDEHSFPFIAKLLFHLDDSSVAKDIILQPLRAHVNGHYCYTFIYAGCCWMYYASKSMSEKLMPQVFTKTGNLYLTTESLFKNAFVIDFVKSRASKDHV